MGEICTDNRFDMIAKYKAKLIESTNIETDKAEMAVIDNILFRFWQMGWLDKLESAQRTGKWEKLRETYCSWSCSVCGEMVVAMPERMGHPLYDFCPNCGCAMKGENDETD